MKITYKNRILNIVILSVFVSILSITLSCETKEVPRLSNERLIEVYLTNSTWTLNRVTVDGMDQTNTYRDLTLTFNKTNYISTDGRIIWPESGTWEFVDQTNSVIRRDDGLLVTIQSITFNRMILTLDWEFTSIDTGRSNAISGSHVFEFMR